jgi:putative acetyltransferase
MTKPNIREERPDDVPAIRRVNQLAFGTNAEADLVDALREQARPIVSLVADDRGAILGHILFSPVTLSSQPELRIMGLAPMAVVPARQRAGIGSALVRAGIDECRRLGVAAIVVLGHAGYYPKFGFRPASRLGLASEYDVPDDVFMAFELDAGVLRGSPGTIRYHSAFPRG